MITGIVSKVFSKQFGDKTLHSFVLQDQDGVYYRSGEMAPGVKQGDVVEFEVKQSGANLYAQLPIKVTGTLSPAKTSRGKGGFKSGVTASGKDDYWTAREERDIEAQYSMRWQGAYERALKLYPLLLEAEAIKPPTTIKKLADRAPYVKGIINELATEIYMDTLKAKEITQPANVPENPIEVSDDEQESEWDV